MKAYVALMRFEICLHLLYRAASSKDLLSFLPKAAIEESLNRPERGQVICKVCVWSRLASHIYIYMGFVQSACKADADSNEPWSVFLATTVYPLVPFS